MHLAQYLVAAALLLVAASACNDTPRTPSIFTLDWRNTTGTTDKMQEYKIGVQQALNYDNSGTGGHPFDACFFKVALPPCGVRTAHFHRNVHELHYVSKGTFQAATQLPDGTIIQDTVTVGQSFIAPANYIHTMVNPSCDTPAEFLAFYTHVSQETTNVASSALELSGSSFQAYSKPDTMNSLRSAADGFAFDPVCLRKCNLGEQGDQQPAADSFTRR